MNAINKIIFLDDPVEARRLFKGRGNDDVRGPETVIIALNPAVNACLVRRGMSPRDSTPYFTNESHGLCLKKSGDIVQWLEKNARLGDIDISVPGRSFMDYLVFYVRFAANHCLWATETATNAITTHHPQALSASVSGRRSSEGQFMTAEERYVGRIVKKIANLKKMKFDDVSSGTAAIRPLYLSRLAVTIGSIQMFAWRFTRFAIWNAKSAPAHGSPTKKVLFTTENYNFGKLACDMKRGSSGIFFDVIPGNAIPSFPASDKLLKPFLGRAAGPIAEARRRIEDLSRMIEREGAVFSHKGVSFGEFVAEKIRTNISDYIIGLCVWSIFLNRMIERQRPEALFSNGNRTDDIIIAEICKRHGVPAVMIPHGTYFGPRDELERFEWGQHGKGFLRAPFSHVAVQAPGAEEYLKVFPPFGKAIRTGPLVWGRPVTQGVRREILYKLFPGRRDIENAKVIVHIGTCKANYSPRFHVYETPDEYVNGVRELATAVRSISNAVLIVRFRPSPQIGIKDIKELVSFSNNIVLSVTEPYGELLGAADIVVSFSSTAIEDALQNKIPVLLYGGSGRYKFAPAVEVESGADIRVNAVYHVRGREHLADAIKRISDIEPNREDGIFKPFIFSEKDRMGPSELLNHVIGKGQ